MEMAKAMKVGTLVEFEFPSGRVYLQVVGARNGVELVRVLDEVYASRPSLDSLAAARERCFAVFPLAMAVKAGLATIVGEAAVDAEAKSQRLRARGVISRDGKTLSWFIREGGGQRVVHALSPEERRLSIDEIWNVALLRERVEQDWRPEWEV
jgi:hypothetical protein